MTLANAILYAILFGLTGLGYWIRVPLIVMLAGFGLIIFGFTLWTLYWWLSVITVFVGGILVWIGMKA